MEDKVISEFRLIETEDGFRVEIKGDKEKMKKMFETMRSGGVGPGRHFRHGMGFGPGFMMRRFFGRHGHGPWNRGWGWDDEEEQPAPAAQPKA